MLRVVAFSVALLACAMAAQSRAQTAPARPDAQGAMSPADETPADLPPMRRHDDFPLPPVPPDGPYANVPFQLYRDCNGDKLYTWDKGGLVMCMGERMNAACGDNLECRYTVHRWVRAELKM